ncbi:LysR family transcriptional regulator, partial [Salmonella enterica subsp. enterica serovar Anatum]|nr:LysR family transcriptional regulator [Salmonella enterica subsp. enterica serovar Anatum]
SSLVARPLGRFRWVTCASPDYLREHGVPPSPEALSQHRAKQADQQARLTDVFPGESM